MSLRLACSDRRCDDRWLADMLTSGGDNRIRLDANGRNKYAIPLLPVETPFRFSSTTASPITARSHREISIVYAAIQEALRNGHSAHEVYARQIAEIESEICRLLGYGARDAKAPRCRISPSGTDAHAMAASLFGGAGTRPATFLTVDEVETGSGVPHALRMGAQSCAADLAAPNSLAPDSMRPRDVLCIPARLATGECRSRADVAADLHRHIGMCKMQGRRAVLIVTDVSKTGLLWPDLATVLDLKSRWGEHLAIVIDACQFRLGHGLVRRYLELGCSVIITGSKFLGGPVFSGALLMPQDGESICARSCADDRHLAQTPQGLDVNFGLVLRWRAALCEWRALASLDVSTIRSAVDSFGTVVSRFIAGSPQLELLPCGALDRTLLGDCDSWSSRPTIFPFLMRSRSESWMSVSQMAELHARLGRLKTPVFLGQPVACGVRDGVPVAALRLSLSAPLLNDMSHAGAAEGVAQYAILALSKALESRL